FVIILVCFWFFVFFFFQAEDGIRDFHVTGVQTCALPILDRSMSSASMASIDTGWRWVGMLLPSRPKVSLADTPSMVILLKRGFMPPAEIEPDARSVNATRGSRRM